MFQQEIAVTSRYIFRSLAKLEKTRVFLNLFQIEPTLDTRSKPQCDSLLIHVCMLDISMDCLLILHCRSTNMAGIRISLIFQTFLKTGILFELIFLLSVDGLPRNYVNFYL